MRKLALGSILLVTLSVPAFGQAMISGYYVVQDTKTKKCTVVDQQPTTNAVINVADGKVFKTRTEAEARMKTVQVCATN